MAYRIDRFADHGPIGQEPDEITAETSDAAKPNELVQRDIVSAVLVGGSGDDAWVGTEDSDTADGNGGNDSLIGNGGHDRLSGGAGADYLDGGSGDDILFSNTRDPDALSFISYRAASDDYGTEIDTLVGGAGDDYFVAGYGDNVDGGAAGSYGNRLYITFRGASSGVTADFRLLQTAGSITIGGAVITNIQTIGFLEGSEFDDLLVPIDTYYPTGANVYGLGGNDHLIANYYSGWGGSVLSGGDGDDILDGRPAGYGPGLYGEAGNDTFYGSGAAYGGDGNDTFYISGTIDGGAGNDTIYLQQSYYSTQVNGGSGDDLIIAAQTGSGPVFGDAGNDTFTGNNGIDFFNGGAGDDVMDGGGQSASIDYAGDVSVYSGNVADYSVTRDSNTGVVTVADLRSGSPDGTDTLTNVELLKFANGTYTIAALLSGLATGVMNFVGTAGADSYYGSEENNTATGLGAADTFYGFGGNDVLQGNGGADHLDGGTGDDWIYSAEPIGSLSRPYYGSTPATLVLDTGTEVDTLVGGDGNDILVAGYGDNVNGGTGDYHNSDRLYLSLLGATAGVTVDFRSPTVTIGGGTITEVESVSWVQGTNFDDDITLANGNYYNGELNVAFGMGGNDRLIAGTSTDYMDGGDGNDIVDGRNSSYNRAVVGGAGDDTLYTSANSSSAAYGDDGNDTIYAHARIDGGAGNDSIYIQSSYYLSQVNGGSGDDLIVASPNGSTMVFGDTGNDTLTGGTGIDLLTGGAGNDTIDGAGQSVTGAYSGDVAAFSGNLADYTVTRDSNTGVVTVVDVRAGSPDGTDSLTNIELLKFTNGTYTVEAVLSGQASGLINFVGTSGIDIFYGSEEANTALGYGGNDTFYGFGGNDTMSGNGGADYLNGGDGDDLLYSRDQSVAYNAPYYSNPWTAPALDAGVEVDTLIGGNGNDRLFAGYGDNIDGGAGSDHLLISFRGATAGVTADFRQTTIVIGGGTITNIEGVDWVEGSNFDDDITMPGTSALSVSFAPIFGLGGNDRLVAGYYTGYMDGGDGDDIVDGRNSQYLQTVIGGAGNDTLYTYTNTFASAEGGDGDDTIFAHAAINGGAGNDTITVLQSYYPGQVRGGTGDDTINVQKYDHTQIFGDDGNDTINGSGGNDTLDGGNGDDSIKGGGGVNALRGGAGNDRFEVTASDGGTVVEGGSELDTLSISGAFTLGGASSGLESIVLDNGTLSVTSSQLSTGFASNTSLTGVGSVVVNMQPGFAVNASGFVITPTNTLTFIVNGSVGNDVVQGVNGIANQLYGGNGIDQLTGGNANDTIDGGAGINTLLGGAGNDRFVVSSSGSGTAIDGGADADTLEVNGNVVLGTVASIEAVQFNSGSALTLTATQYKTGFVNPVLNGTGLLIIDIGAADPVISLTGLTVAGGSSIDITINGSNGPDQIKGALSVSNTISGGVGADQIRGGLLADTINGGDQNDKIFGYGGADILTGGAGADQFRYLFASDSGTGANADRITDFLNGTDRLNFALLDADPVAAGRQALTFIDTVAFTATGAAQVRYGTSGADLLVQVDLDGNGTADMEIVLAGASGQVLTGGDFML